MKLGTRIVVMAGIGLLIVVALMLVRGLVHERAARAVEVQDEIAKYSARAQTLVGPYLVLPYTDVVTVFRPGTNAAGGTWEQETRKGSLEVAPSNIRISGDMKAEMLKRAIFETPIYATQFSIEGEFHIPAQDVLDQDLDALPDKPSVATTHSSVTPVKSPNKNPHVRRIWGKPMLSMGIPDPRGIRALEGAVDQKQLAFEPGSHLKHMAEGTHALMPGLESGEKLPSGQTFGFKLNLHLAGSQSLMFEPAGNQYTLALKGDWPHPSFTGNFSPVSRTVTATGFEVLWQTNKLALGVATGSQRLGLKLFDPVDRYKLSERTAKYGELFVLLIFGAVFLMEVLRSIKVHPMQYILTGAALSLFFLLVLSLSEHLPFDAAYLIAATAAVALLSFYSGAIVRSTRHGLGFGAMVGLLYALLFGILRAEDSALLIGSLFLFAMLATFMILTRRVDWNTVGSTR